MIFANLLDLNFMFVPRPRLSRDGVKLVLGLTLYVRKIRQGRDMPCDIYLVLRRLQKLVDLALPRVAIVSFVKDTRPDIVPVLVVELFPAHVEDRCTLFVDITRFATSYNSQNR